MPDSVHPQQTATSGADGVDVHHGHPNRVAGDLARCAYRGHAAPDHRHVAARPADVDGHRVPAARRVREARATDNAPRRPGQKQVDGPARRGADGGDAAAGLHDVDLAGDAVLAKALLHVRERPLHRRAHVGIEGGHRGPFVLAVDGVHLRGERDEQVGIQRADDLSRAHFVRVVLEREQVDHRHRLDPVLRLHLDDRPGDEVLVERLDDPAGGVQPLGNAHPVTLGRQEYRCLHVDVEVVHGPALEPADLQHVLESLGGEDGEPRPRPLHHDVGGKGGTEHDSLHVLRLAIQEAEDLADAV